MTQLLEVADLNKRGPQLECRFDYPDCIFNDADQVVLKEVRLQTVERLLHVCGEHTKRINPLLASARASRRDESSLSLPDSKAAVAELSRDSGTDSESSRSSLEL
jgi:hypothetical protein